MLKQLVVAASAFAALAATVVCAANKSDSNATVSVDRQYTLTVGTAEQRRFHDAIAAGIDPSGMVGTLADLDAAVGTVEVKSSMRRHPASASDADVRATFDSIADPMSTAAEAGDKFSYHYCNNRKDRLWQLVFQRDDQAAAGHWAVEGYSASAVKACTIAKP